MLQCVSVCCSVLQCVAVLQSVAECCSVLQCVAVCYSASAGVTCSVCIQGGVWNTARFSRNMWLFSRKIRLFSETELAFMTVYKAFVAHLSAPAAKTGRSKGESVNIWLRMYTYTATNIWQIYGEIGLCLPIVSPFCLN